MQNRWTKAGLAIFLSKLKTFATPKLADEQYSTDSELAAAFLWEAYMRGDIAGKSIADLGAGTGILGVGALLLGAKKVFFVEKDREAIQTAKENLQLLVQGEATFECKDIKEFNEKVDTAIENPPFGTKREHADRIFLEKAFEIANKIYSIHKSTSKDFIDAISQKHGFEVVNIISYQMPLKATHSFHKKRIERVNIGIWILRKKVF